MNTRNHCIALALAISSSTILAQDPVPSYGQPCGTRLHGSEKIQNGVRELTVRVVDAFPGAPVALVAGNGRVDVRLPGVTCPLLVDPLATLALTADQAGFARLSVRIPASVGGYVQAIPFLPGAGIRASNGLRIDALHGGGTIGTPCASQCDAHKMIIGCDNRVRGPLPGQQDKAPWNMVGRLTTGGTGTLIADKFVLTAAHNVYKNGQFISGPIGFRLAQALEDCSGYMFGTRYVARVYVPKGYTGADDGVSRALDYALLELKNPLTEGKKMQVAYLDWFDVKDRETTAIGYPFDKWPPGSAWYGRGAFASSQPWRWLDGGEKGLFRVSNDGTGGMSGGPLYVWKGGHRKLVGVFIGSPVSECVQGYVWASRMTPGAIDQIENVKTGGNLDFWRRKTFTGNDVPPDILSGC